MYATSILHRLGPIEKILVFGIIATIVMDLWNVVLYFTLGIELDWSLMGRWVGHILQGNFILYGIETASKIEHEAVLGWVVHYATGIVYGLCFLLFCYRIIYKKPNLLWAIIVAFCFMVMPFLLYQPAIGLGYFASKASDPDFVRQVTLSMHFFFGVGLYIAYRLLRYCRLKVPFSNKDP